MGCNQRRSLNSTAAVAHPAAAAVTQKLLATFEQLGVADAAGSCRVWSGAGVGSCRQAHASASMAMAAPFQREREQPPSTPEAALAAWYHVAAEAAAHPRAGSINLVGTCP